MTLAGLLQGLQDIDVDEVIIADGEARTNAPHNLTAKLSQNLRGKLTWLPASPKGRGSQIQAGITQASADYVWVLHADSHIDTRAPKAIRKILAREATSLGTFTLKFNRAELDEKTASSGARSLALFAWVSRMDSALTTFGDQGFFFRREDYVKLGLDLAQYPLLEDVALRRAFKRRGRVTRSSVPIVTSARRFARRGIWKTQLFNTQILWRYMRGESPSSLYLDYYQPPVKASVKAHEKNPSTTAQHQAVIRA